MIKMWVQRPKFFSVAGETRGLTYSRVQNASLVPAFQNSDLQANATGVYSTNCAQILPYKVREYFPTSAEA